MYEQRDFYNWAIVRKVDHEVMGSVSIHSIDVALKKGELGYSLGKAFWSKGIMSEAVSEIIKFAFDHVGFFLLVGKTEVTNRGSLRVMQKCGMKYRETIVHQRDANHSVTEELYILENVR